MYYYYYTYGVSDLIFLECGVKVSFFNNGTDINIFNILNTYCKN